MGRRRVQSSGGGGFWTLVGVLFIIGLIIRYIWWILGALAIVAACFVVRALIGRYHAAVAARERAHAEIAARADEQHTWVLGGDDRGIYGSDGARLMHYIDGGAHDEIIRKDQPNN